MPLVDWQALLARIKGGDPTGTEELHRLLSRGIRFYLSRRLGLQKLEERVKETFTILTNALKAEVAYEHEPSMNLVRTIVVNQLTTYTEEEISLRRQPWVEGPHVVTVNQSAFPKTVDRMAVVLANMSPRGREALTRFYFREQPQERICEEMLLSETEFGLMKATVKASFDELIRPGWN
jgi:hypothetical protein